MQKVNTITGGRMAEVVMEASGANPATLSALELVSNAGRVIFTGWPKQNTPIPTGTITKKEIEQNPGAYLKIVGLFE